MGWYLVIILTMIMTSAEAGAYLNPGAPYPDEHPEGMMIFLDCGKPLKVRVWIKNNPGMAPEIIDIGILRMGVAKNGVPALELAIPPGHPAVGFYQKVWALMNKRGQQPTYEGEADCSMFDSA